MSSLCVRSFLWSRRGLMRASHSKCSIHQRDWFVLGLFRLYTPEEWKLCIVASQNKTVNFKCKTLDEHIYIYIHMFFVSDLQHTPTSEDSSVAAGVATVATWWEDCFGENISDTGILWRPKNIRNHSWRYCTHHAHKTSLPSFPHCPFQKTAIKRLSSLCVRSFLWSRRGLMRASHSKCSIHQRDWFVLGLFRLYTPEEWKLCIVASQNKTVNFKCKTLDEHIYIYIHMFFVSDLQHTPTSEDSSVAAGVATVATWWEDCFGENISDTGILWRPKNIRNHSWRYCTHHAHKTSLPSFPHCPFQKTAIKRLSSLCVRNFLWSRRGLMRASHSKCFIHQRDWFVLGCFNFAW